MKRQNSVFMNFAAFVGCLVVSSVSAEVPYQFEGGMPASSAQVNANFANIDSRLSALETTPIGIDCTNDPTALQAQWDQAVSRGAERASYNINGTCNFEYSEWGSRYLDIRGSGPNSSRIIGSIYQSSVGNYVRLSNLTFGPSSNEQFNGEILRPSSGSTLVLNNVVLAQGATISGWDAFTRIYIGGGQILAPVNLYSAQLNVQHAQLTSLSATSSRVYFHGGGLTGNLYLANSRAQFQPIGVPNGESYITGGAYIKQSQVVLSGTSAGGFSVNHGSAITLEGDASVADLFLLGSTLHLQGGSVQSGRIGLNLSNAFVDIDTALNYECANSSHVVGDPNNASAINCR